MAEITPEHGTQPLFSIEDLHARPTDATMPGADGVDAVRAERPGLGVPLTTHYQKLLDHITPDVVHILLDGRIVDSGGHELSERLEQEGFDQWRANA